MPKTPEEWAAKIAKEFEMVEGLDVDEPTLAENIRQIIAESVAEEREACARVCREITVYYLRGPQTEWSRSKAEAADRCNIAIRSRGEASVGVDPS